ncbi:MAG: hypothetical protein ACRDTT_22860 [Pseudonocardiaceae bacterium]
MAQRFLGTDGAVQVIDWGFPVLGPPPAHRRPHPALRLVTIVGTTVVGSSP